jgi:hypothetical protein
MSYFCVRIANRSARRRLVLGILSLMLGACAGISKEMETYQLETRHYEQALRWQDYDAVISFHKDARKSITPQSLKRLKKYKVTAYKVISNVVSPDMQHADETVEIKYFNTDYQLVRDLTLQNRWEYDAKQNRWFLINPLPAFR